MRSILVVDDNPLFREAMAMVLEAEGYRVKTVPDVDHAEEAIRSCHFDVIVSDYDMPHKNGLELLRQLRRESINIPFVMVSASDDVCVEAEALLLGAFSFIAKPFKKVDLINTASRAIAANGNCQHPNATFDPLKDDAA